MPLKRKRVEKLGGDEKKVEQGIVGEKPQFRISRQHLKSVEKHLEDIFI